MTTREQLRQDKRLLNVAKALRESPNPKAFDMCLYGYDGRDFPCGTPACAFGHYAARRDLQSSFRLNKFGNVSCRTGSNYWGARMRHFGIDLKEDNLLFTQQGCNFARTTIQAAKFIDKFVAKRQKARK